MMASLRNSGMLLFRPVALNTHLLKEMVPAGGSSYVDFCMVKDPLVSLRRCKAVGQQDVVLLLNKSDEGSTVSHNGNNGNGHQRFWHIFPRFKMNGGTEEEFRKRSKS